MDKIVPYLHTLPRVQAPLSVQINITNRCYSKCIMCAKWRDWPKEDFLSTEKLIDLFDTFNSMGVQSVVLSGGEPFAREDLLEIVKNKGKLKIGVLTSGLWNPKLKSEAEKIIKNLDLIHFSLDSIYSETYNLIRGTQGNACEEVKGNLIWTNNLIKSGLSQARIKVNIVKQKLNVNEIDDIVNFCKEHEIPYRISPVHTFDELKADDNFYIIPQRCVVPFFHCVVDFDGEVFFCCHLLNDNDYYSNRNIQLSIGNVLKESFIEIWFGKKAKNMRKFLMNHKFPECSRCDNRYIHINQAYEEYIQKLSEPIFL